MKKRKRVQTIEQKIITNLILLGRTPRAAYQEYKNLMFKSEMKFISINS